MSITNRDPLRLRVVVLATNSNGEPAFFPHDVVVSWLEYHAGAHYDLAKEAAEEAGYEEPMIAFDPYDRDGKQLSDSDLLAQITPTTF